MLLMESYMCYCSVRLGVIIVSVLAIIRELAHSITLFALGIKVFEPLNDLFEHDAEFKNRKWVRKFISWSEGDPEVLSAVVHIISFMHSAAACLSIYGAIKLRKWFLLPLAFFEFVYFIHITFLHIVLMIMLKKQINLGFLIILTLLGCFYICKYSVLVAIVTHPRLLSVFVGYNACTCVAMFQIIGLVKSARYCELYGDDPFHPLAMRSNRSKDSEKPLHVLRMHEMHDTNIDEEKRLSKLGLWPRRQPPVVSVLPVQAAYPHPPLKWWQQQALSTGDDHQPDPSVYRNWHTNELLNGVGGNFQRKSELNRRYAENQLHRWY